MKVLVLGSGGREHAFAQKLAQSSLLTKLYIAPGNAGTAEEGENVDLDIADFEQVSRFVSDAAVDMVVIGPEQPLVDGLVDYLESEEIHKNLTIVGPCKAGAQLEGSKDFSKRFMQKYGIPTARYRSFQAQEIEEAKEFLKSLHPPYVLKADGLAAGKGVIISDSYQEACEELTQMLTHSKFGSASTIVLIEEFLKGIELSVFVLTDGKNYKILPTAKDYKRIGDGDKGLNTGGMGSVSPMRYADTDFMKKVENKIVKPTVEGLLQEGIDYRGFLFIGLMKQGGEPYVIEYNVRMGDPETESVFLRIHNDFLEMFFSLKTQSLDKIQLHIDSQTALCVVLAAQGYPESYRKGDAIKIAPFSETDVQVFHAGTKAMPDGCVCSAGGRVLALTVKANTLEEAKEKAYRQIQHICFEGMYYRKDIGLDLL